MADISVLNTSSALSGKTLLTKEGDFTISGAFTFSAPVTITSSSASALDVTGGINAGSGNVGIVDTTGKIPAISSTYFASLSGSNITNVALLDAANTFTSSGAQTVAGILTLSTSTAGANGCSIFKSGTTFVMTGGTSGFLWSSQDNVTNLATLGNTGQLSLLRFQSTGHQIVAGGVGDQNVVIRNTTAGTANQASLYIGNDASASLITLTGLSSTYTSSGRLQANGVVFESSGAGGISIGATNASGVMRFYGNGATQRAQIAAGVTVGDTTDPGATNFRVAGTSLLIGALNITSSLQCDSIVNDTGLASGTYAPTVTQTANLDAAPTFVSNPQYMRVGNTVTVSGTINSVNPTSSGVVSTYRITLPVASNIGGSGHLSGAGSGTDVAGLQYPIKVYGDAANDAAVMEFIPTGTTDPGGVTQSIIFTYQVI